MTIRAGMAELINELRTMTQVTSADYAVEGIGTVWIDEDLQDVLDEYRMPFSERAQRRARYSGGSAQYFEFAWTRRPVERIASGTGVFEVTTAAGSAFGTAAFSVNYRAGVVTFTNDQGATDVYVHGRQYDIKGAAARLWRHRAAYLAQTAMDISTDNHNVKRSQLYAHAMRMAETYEAESFMKYGGVEWESGVGRLSRSDAY